MSKPPGGGCDDPPGRCPRCGEPTYATGGIIRRFGESEPVRIIQVCVAPGCGTTCPICHRRPGDIHSGACAPIVLRKVDDPTRISAEDCLTAVR